MGKNNLCTIYSLTCLIDKGKINNYTLVPLFYFFLTGGGKMVVEIKVIQEISQEFRAWIESIRNDKKIKEESFRKVIKSLSIAVLDTRRYLAEVGDERIKYDPAKEEAIMLLWHEASLDLQPLNPHLAERCFDKSQFWADPRGFTDNEIDKYNINLDAMADELRALYLQGHR
jgi:hypothetical protein